MSGKMIKIIEGIDSKSIEFLIQEDYFGKNPELLKVEELITSIKKMKGNPNKFKEMREIESILGNLFGFEKVNLFILPQESSMNAFTIPFFWEKDYPDSFFQLEQSSKGIKFRNPKGKNLLIYLHSYTLKKLTTEEVVGIILHEIGHNFYLVDEQVKNYKMRSMSGHIIMLLRELLYSILNYEFGRACSIVGHMLGSATWFKSPQNYYRQLYDKYTDSNENYENAKQTVLVKIVSFVGSITGFFKNLAFFIFYPFVALMIPTVIASGLNHLASQAKEFDSYADEKFSDNFAITYGYGAGVAKTFSRRDLSVKEAISSKIPIVSFLDKFSNAYMEMVVAIYDCHPSSLKRVRMTKEKLEHELKNNIDQLLPSQIVNIKQDLENIEKIVKAAEKGSLSIHKWFDKMGLIKKKDDAGTKKIKDKDIFDFREKILKRYLGNSKKSESTNPISEETNKNSSIFL